MLTLHNTLSGTKEVFQPLDSPTVTMYNCGPTVYDYAHIGNLRAYVFADTLRRTLEHNDYKVKQVINITDVGHLTNDDSDTGDDKVESQARKQKKSADDIIAFYTDAFFKDLSDLNVKTDGTVFPRATEHIKEQLELIQTLEEQGHTYQTSDGIYFDTSTFDEYGKLGQIDLAGNKAGARVAHSDEKRNPTDFALWKFSSPDEERQQEWDSPWGTGFPGWHIECSAMSMKYLGETFDIHTGGIDHIPIHHNNEIAQSECATGKPFARFWLHNAFLDIKGEKMAKSVGNFFTLRDITNEGITAMTYRWWLLTAHYRSPVSFDPDVLKGLEGALERLADQLAGLPEDGSVPDEVSAFVTEHLNDDLDTPALIARLWELSKDNKLSDADKRASMEHIMNVLGIDLVDYETEALDPDELPDELAKLINERENARTRGAYDEADRLRDEIVARGYEVADTDDGPRVKPLR